MTRVPPSNVQAEQQVLGALLCKEVSAYPEFGDILRHGHFADPLHGRIYDAIENHIRAALPENQLLFDAIQGDLSAAFEDHLQECGGIRYLGQLAKSYRTNPVDLRPAAETVVGAWHRRRVVDVADILSDTIAAAIKDAFESTGPGHEISTVFAWAIDDVRNQLPVEGVSAVVGQHDPDEYGMLPDHAVALSRDEINLLHDHYIYAAKQTQARKRQSLPPDLEARHAYYKARAALFERLLPSEQGDQDEIEEAFNQVVDPATIRHDGELVDGHVVTMRHPDDPEPA